MKKFEIIELLQRGVDPVRINDQEQAVGIYERGSNKLLGYRLWGPTKNGFEVKKEVRL